MPTDDIYTDSIDYKICCKQYTLPPKASNLHAKSEEQETAAKKCPCSEASFLGKHATLQKTNPYSHFPLKIRKLLELKS